MAIDWNLILDSIPALLEGLQLTLMLTGISLVAGALLALFLAWFLVNPFPVMTFLSKAHVFFYRGTPMLVQIFLIYYGAGQFSEFFQLIGLWWFFKSAYLCGLLALTLNTAGYMAEILRGGLQSVPKGEIEAGLCVGLNPLQIFFRITLPRALSTVFPSMGNEAILLLKATSLTSTITLMELTGVAQKLASDTFAPIEIFMASGLLYLVMVGFLSLSFRWIEKRFFIVPA